MNLSLLQFSLAMAGSFIAGAINTLAGNGSVITLSILTDLIGLPGNLANGTNRVGVLFQTAGSSAGFAQSKMMNLFRSKHIIVLTIIGALCGVYCATIVSNEDFLSIFKYLLIVMLIVVLIKPERWLGESDIVKLPYWFSVPVFIVLGFYGGFIQMGMGIFFLAVLVLVSKFSIMEANAVKTMVIFIYTILVLAIFAWNGLVNWKIGIIMAIGQTLGGYLTALYSPLMPDINLWAYRLLVFIIITSILIQFGLLKLFIQ
ncbi:MAG: sulfite exporter TauE/SafE family protein [Saprospiraceae bacterium]|nr:sulfite exporter TauE/SafE family protein [Saprospiraceae bacterium]